MPWTGSSWTNSTLQECLTGVDANTQLPDAGCTIYLGSDGTIRNYGSPVWIDPNPQFDVKPDLPKGYFDFIGVLTHEIFHCLGFYGVTDQWKKFVVKDGNKSYFDGPITKSLLGGALPLAPDGNSDHYGNIALATNNAPRGLMWQFGNYERNRLDIGRIDLAVLQDLGYQIKTYEGLPLFELSDSSPNITGTNASETLYGNYQHNVISGFGGNDTLDGGAGTDTAIFSGNQANYTVRKTGTGYILVDKKGADGTDTLLNIEAIKFTDKTINLTVQAKAASAPQADVIRLVELYTAFFNRVPDADGMSFWIGEIKAGKTINQVAESFYNAGVNYSSLTGFSSTMKNADFINVIYKNVLGRKDGADAGGLSFWEGEITSGRATRGTLVTNILDSAHTFKGDKTWGWVADLLDNKITVAKKFSIDMGLNYNTPEESITKGMAIASAITPTDTSAAVTLIGVTEANFLLV